MRRAASTQTNVPAAAVVMQNMISIPRIPSPPPFSSLGFVSL
nr:MAG TPA: hypothetical protein [Caudoviricetes sp.]